MKEIVDWLITIEQAANKFYLGSADSFPDDPELKSFLLEMSYDEAEHYHIMASAAHYLEGRELKKPQFILDTPIRDRIEAPFNRGLGLLGSAPIQKEAVVDILVESEYSEWNDIFLYILNTLKAEDRIFEQAEIRIHRHLRRLEHYLNKFAYGRDKLASLVSISHSKKEQVLIVDDEAPIAQLLAALLDDICDSDIAYNGAEALDKIKAKTYGLVISDIDMPVMDGINLYQRAKSHFLKPQDSFLFHSGNLVDAHLHFFTTNKLTFMTKPSSITQIRDTVLSKFHLK